MAQAGNDRRAEILRVAAELFAVQGVAATPVRAIADRVGILSGSLYHYFGSKDDMVTELVLGWLDQLVAAYDEAGIPDLAPREALRMLVDVSLATVADHPHAIEIYQNDAGYLAQLPAGAAIAERASKVPAMWLGVIQRGIDDGVFRTDVPARVFYNMLRDALWRSVTWFDPDASRSTSQLADDYATVFLDGFAASPESGRDGAAD